MLIYISMLGVILYAFAWVWNIVAGVLVAGWVVARGSLRESAPRVYRFHHLIWMVRAYLSAAILSVATTQASTRLTGQGVTWVYGLTGCAGIFAWLSHRIGQSRREVLEDTDPDERWIVAHVWRHDYLYGYLAAAIYVLGIYVPALVTNPITSGVLAVVWWLEELPVVGLVMMVGGLLCALGIVRDIALLALAIPVMVRSVVVQLMQGRRSGADYSSEIVEARWKLRDATRNLLVGVGEVADPVDHADAPRLSECLRCDAKLVDGKSWCPECGAVYNALMDEDPVLEGTCHHHPEEDAYVHCSLGGEPLCFECSDIDTEDTFKFFACDSCYIDLLKASRDCLERLSDFRACVKHSSLEAVTICNECSMPLCDRCTYYVTDPDDLSITVGPLCIACLKFYYQEEVNEGHWTIAEAETHNECV